MLNVIECGTIFPWYYERLWNWGKLFDCSC